MLDYGKIGQRIRKIRKAHNLSQEQLAEMVYISTTHMSHIETGTTKLSLPVLVDIAKALNVGVDYLLEENGIDVKTPVNNEICSVLEACTTSQMKIICEIIKSTKSALDRYE